MGRRHRKGVAMAEVSRSRILGWGFKVPRTVITNDDLAEIVDTSDEWVFKRTGIRERRYVDNGEGSVPLAEAAALEAMARAGIEPEQIDVVLCGSLSPDIDSPGNAALLQQRLGLAPKLVFDVRNQCSSFIYGVVTADQFIRAGGARYVLVVGSEVHSSGLDFQGRRGRDVTVLFGDGAGAIVVGAGDDAHGLLAFNLHADGEFAEKLAVLGPGSRSKPRLPPELLPPESPYVYPVMEGRYVFKHAVQRMTESINEVLAAAGLTTDDLDMLLPHQANLRINEFVAAQVGLCEAKVANNIERYGNTTAATIPILLSETMAAGRISPGDIVCMSAFGAGFTWGSALYRW